MKIIGRTKQGFIVVVEQSDFEKLTGYYYGERTFEVGDELRIDPLYRQLNFLITQEDEIRKIVHALKTAAGMLEKIDPVFYKPEKK